MEATTAAAHRPATQTRTTTPMFNFDPELCMHDQGRCTAPAVTQRKVHFADAAFCRTHADDFDLRLPGILAAARPKTTKRLLDA